MNIAFNQLQEHCCHQGMIKEGKKWCSFANGVPAKCWTDWQECHKDNCPLTGCKPKPEPTFKQLSIQDVMGGAI